MAQTGCAAPRNPTIALVLAGGAARGAYEAGVVQYLLEDVSREIGRDVSIDILCGTSAGAINACFLAAFADEPRARAARLVDEWTTLDLPGVVRTEKRAPLELFRLLLGRRPPSTHHHGRGGGLLNPSGIERVVRKAIPFERIGPNVKRGHLQAVTVSTTHVATGRTVVFVESAHALGRGRDSAMILRPTSIGLPHAMASAAIPLLFPAVPIGGEYYCDGGLRQNVPLSPARRLGADGLIVISPRYLPEEAPNAEVAMEQKEAPPGPLFLLGKTLNALLLDRIDADIDRLQRINAILEAGCRRYGSGFIEEINRELYGDSKPISMRPIRSVLIRASQDIGRLAAEFVRRPSFLARPRRAIVGRVLRRLAEGEGRREADFLSYLLFDGEFCGQLIELGRADARARHAELCSFFSWA